MPKHLNEEQARTAFRKWVGKRPQNQVALELKISASYLSDMLNGRRFISDQILDILQLQRRVVYERVNNDGQ